MIWKRNCVDSVMKNLHVLLFLTLFGSAAYAQGIYFDVPNADQIAKKTFTPDPKLPEIKADIYTPRKPANKKLPVFILLNGIGATWIREDARYISWASLVTAHGFAGITMDSQAEDPMQSVDKLVKYLADNPNSLGVDPENIVVYACSSNVSQSLLYLMGQAKAGIRGAIIFYGSSDVRDFRLDLPVFYVRAGLDATVLNQRIDELTAKAVKANAPWQFRNYSSGHHGFEFVDNTSETRYIVSQALEFMKLVVSPAYQQNLTATVGEAELASLLAVGDWEKSLQSIIKMQTAGKTSADIKQKLGLVYTNLGQPDLALSAYDESLKMGSPNRGLITYEKAKLLLQKKDTVGSVAALESIKDIKPMMDRAKNDPFFEGVRKKEKYNPVFR